MQSHNISTDSQVLHPISLHPISSLHPIFRCTQFWVHPISCTQFFAPNLCTQFFYAAPNSLHPICLGHIFVRKNSAPNCLHPIFYSFFMHICDKIWVRHGWTNWVQAFRFTVFESNKISQKKLGAAKKKLGASILAPKLGAHFGKIKNWVQTKLGANEGVHPILSNLIFSCIWQYHTRSSKEKLAQDPNQLKLQHILCTIQYDFACASITDIVNLHQKSISVPRSWASTCFKLARIPREFCTACKQTPNAKIKQRIQHTHQNATHQNTKMQHIKMLKCNIPN